MGKGLAASKVPREQLYLTSKIHPRDLGYNQTLAAFERVLGHLRTTYLDLLLLHYPACFPGANCVPMVWHSWQKSWGALEDLVRQGKVRSIGERPAPTPPPHPTPAPRGKQTKGGPRRQLCLHGGALVRRVGGRWRTLLGRARLGAWVGLRLKCLADDVFCLRMLPE